MNTERCEVCGKVSQVLFTEILPRGEYKKLKLSCGDIIYKPVEYKE